MENYDCCELPDSSERTFIENLKIRFSKREIYTNIAKVLLALNPQKDVKHLHGQNVMKQYRSGISGGSHIYAIGARIVNNLKKEKSQSVVITGISGAGKTENTKHLLQFLCDQSIENGFVELVNDSNCILEAFGNARTPENNNSSRFIKLMEINFDSQCMVTSIYTKYHLLETSRVCAREDLEGNFHIFHILCDAPKDLKELLYLTVSTSTTHCKDISFKTNFVDIDRILSNIFTTDVKQNLYKLLAGIMHLSKIEFDQGNDGACFIAETSEPSLHIVASLLGLEYDRIKESLTTRQVEIVRRNESDIFIPMNIFAAKRARDSLCRAIYGSIFQHIIDSINGHFMSHTGNSKVQIFDVPGFECFKGSSNNFEQFCINYLNEKIQGFCTNRLIDKEKRWYDQEGIEIPIISFLSNEHIVDLLENRILPVLADESKMLTQHSPANFIETLKNVCGTNKSFDVPKREKQIYSKTSFVIRHFNNAVTYSVEQFVEKNTEMLSKSLRELLTGLMGSSKINNMKTISESLRSQLSNLLSTLEQTETHFVRCVKTNNSILNVFDEDFILQQLKSSGSMAYFKLMKNGYPDRKAIHELNAHFSPYFKSTYENKVEFCFELLRTCGLKKNDFKIGRTEVFIRPGKVAPLNNILTRDPDAIKSIVRQREKVKTKWRRIIKSALLRHRYDKIISEKAKELYQNDCSDFASVKRKSLTEKNDCNEGNVAKKKCGSARLDLHDHFAEYDNKPNYSRCELQGCTKKTQSYCMKCHVYLCLVRGRNCFYDYHHHHQHQRKKKCGSARLDLHDHFAEYDNKPNYSRCKLQGCTKKTQSYCMKCHVYLCLVRGRNCFYDYHHHQHQQKS